MITDADGVMWGTTTEIREHTQLPITNAMLHNWVTRKGLRKARVKDDAGRPRVLFAVIQAAQIWRDTRSPG